MDMKLIVFFFIVSALHTSWQQESIETINETLDRLIQQTNLVEHSEKNVTNFYITKNNSRIFFLNPSESTKNTEKSELKKVTSIKTGNDNPASITDILHALGLGDSKSVNEANHDVSKNKVIKEITLTVEENTKPQKTNADSGDVKELLEDLISRGGRPAQLEDIPGDAILAFTSERGSNVHNKYPEIIIDRITYHNDKNKTGTATEPKALEVKEQQVTETAVHKNNYHFAQELKSLLEELHNMKADTAEMKLQTSEPKMAQKRHSREQPCGNVLMPYSSLCDSVLYNKLPEYQNYNGIINRAGDSQFDTSLQLNRWGPLNARQNELMRISMAQKLKRIRFIMELNNNKMPRFVYRPLYGYI